MIARAPHHQYGIRRRTNTRLGLHGVLGYEAMLDTVIAGVKAGELDEHLAQQAKRVEYPSRNILPERKPQVPAHVELALNPPIEPAAAT